MIFKEFQGPHAEIFNKFQGPYADFHIFSRPLKVVLLFKDIQELI